MSRAVGHEADQLMVRFAVLAWLLAVKNLAQHPNHVNIGSFAIATDVVAPTDSATF
jgi:hypothetical protein